MGHVTQLRVGVAVLSSNRIQMSPTVDSHLYERKERRMVGWMSSETGYMLLLVVLFKLATDGKWAPLLADGQVGQEADALPIVLVTPLPGTTFLRDGLPHQKCPQPNIRVPLVGASVCKLPTSELSLLITFHSPAFTSLIDALLTSPPHQKKNPSSNAQENP